MDPNDNLPNIEPTPQSPAPSQTSPVTSQGSPSQAPFQDQQQTSMTTPPGASPKKMWLAMAICGLLVVLIAGFLLLSPWSPIASKTVSTGAKLTVGSQPFRHACGVVDKEVVAKEVGVQSDINKENINALTAYDPASNEKEVDLLKETGSNAIYSSCSLKMDRLESGAGEDKRNSFISVTVSIGQYKDNAMAKEVFADEKAAKPNAKSLPDFAGTSLYSAPKAALNTRLLSISPVVLHKNMLITVNMATQESDPSGENAAGRVSTIVKDIANRIDKGEGLDLHDYSKTVALKGTPLVDVCRTTDFKNVTAALGNSTELKKISMSHSQVFAPDTSGGAPENISSTCSFGFRTQTEKENEAAAKPQYSAQEYRLGDAYEQKFPHHITLQTSVLESSASAQKYIEFAKQRSQNNAEQNKNAEFKSGNLTVGDKALYALTESSSKGFSDPTEETKIKAYQYFIANGKYAHMITVTYRSKDKPFKSEVRSITDDQVKQIYDELAAGIKRTK